MASDLEQTFHAIRNELHIIVVNAELLVSTSGDGALADSVTDMHASANRLRSLLDHVMQECRDR